MPMLAIEVEVNGKRHVLAGASDLAVLTASVAAIGLLGEETKPFRPGRRDGTDIRLHVNGITARRASPDAHLDWIAKLLLKPGDTVIFRILQVDKADAPVGSINTPTPAQMEAAAAEDARKRRGLTARSSATRRKRRAPKRGR
jgi:hypothetical protein